MSIENFEHITLTTGHRSISRPSHVKNKSIIELFIPAIRDAVRSKAPVTIPVVGRPYSLSASVVGKTLLLKILKSNEPLLTMGVAIDHETGKSAWQLLHEVSDSYLPVVTSSVCAPKRPWIAVRLELGIVFAPDAMEWLGDFEQCIAWAFVKMQNSKNGCIEGTELHQTRSSEDTKTSESDCDVANSKVTSSEQFCFAIGRPCPVTVPDTGALQFSAGGLLLLANFPGPDKYEIQAFKSGHPVRIGVAKIGRLGFLLANFGEGVLLDFPFDIGIEAPENRPYFEGLTPNSRIVLPSIAIDGNSNIVFGMRSITLSPRVTTQILRILAEQSMAPISRSEYTDLVDHAYAKYPDTKDLIRISLAMDKAGG